METWDAIRSRRDVREYADVPLRPDELDQVLEAGRRSPSSRNWQPWDFVVVTERASLKKLTGVWMGAGHAANAAAAIVLVGPTQTEERKRQLLEYDLGQATMNMMIAATDLGLGTCHSRVDDQDLARELLGIPQDHFAAYFFSLGHPANGPLKPVTLKRRPFDEVVHRGRW